MGFGLQIKASGDIVIAAGFLPRDAELKHTNNDIPYTKFSIKAGDTTNEKGEKIAIWRDCICWRDMAYVAESFKKGDTALCIGRLNSRSYDGRDGEKRTAIELVCEYAAVMAKPQRQGAYSNSTQYQVPQPPPIMPESDEFDDGELPF